MEVPNMRKFVEPGKAMQGGEGPLLEPNAKDSLYDKNEAGVEYEVKGGVGHKDNLGGQNTRT